MLRKIILIITTALVINSAGQTIEEYIQKIDLKLKKDKNYLNLFYINFQPDRQIFASLSELPRALRDPYQMKFEDGVNYRLVFLKEGYGLGIYHLLYLEEIKQNDAVEEKLFAAVDQLTDDTTKVLNFRDIYALKYSNPEKYEKLEYVIDDFLSENDEEYLPSLLGINPDESIQGDFGVASRDNEDFLRFAEVNNPHYYPKQKKDSKTFGRRKAENVTPLRLDLSFSKLSVSHEMMDFLFGSASFEVTTEDKLLNLLPYQSSSISAGVRTLIAFSENGNHVNDAVFIDATVMARFVLNNPEIYGNLPFVNSESPRLNFTNGVVGDITFTRPFGLPFMRAYFSLSGRDFENPVYTIGKEGHKTGYYTFHQFGFNMSFFWNTTDRATSRFRMDVGFGFYDIFQAFYPDSTNSTSTQFIENQYQPDLKIHYNYVPNESPLLGGSLRFFDSIVTLDAWIKIVEFSDVHALRLEAKFLSAPFMRSLKEWETEQGSFFQLRYRYGL